MQKSKLLKIAALFLTIITYSEYSAARFLQGDPVGYKDDMDLYTYVGNDPINNTDPTGMYTCNGTKDQCNQFAKDFKTIKAASTSDKLTKTQQSQLKGVVKTLGAPGVKNGVSVNAANLGANGRAAQLGKPDGVNKINVDVNVENKRSNVAGGAAIAHEIKHAQDYASEKPGTILTSAKQFEFEKAAYKVNSDVFEGNDQGSFTPEQIENMANQSLTSWCGNTTAEGCK
jgi:hypothetical protein